MSDNSQNSNLGTHADYDQAKYDYKTYWDHRFYEDLSEKSYLEKVAFPISVKYNKSSNWYCDIGGAFGRFEDISSKFFKNRVILDYSKINLQDVKNDAKLIQADGYDMPFIDNSISTFLSVRVSHHILDQEKFLKEVYRCLAPKGTFIYEIANKNHFKAVISNILKLNFKFISEGFIQQSAGNGEVPFRNYTVKYVLDIANKLGYSVISKTSRSNFRTGPFGFTQKNPSFWNKLENIFQPIFNFFNFGPSIFVILQKNVDLEYKEKASFEEILKSNPKSIEDKIYIYR